MHAKFFDKEQCFETYSTLTLLLNDFSCRDPTLETMVHCMEMIQLEYKFSDKTFVSSDKYFSLHTILLFCAVKILSWQVLWCFVPRWNRKASFQGNIIGNYDLYSMVLKTLISKCVCDLVNWTKYYFSITCHGQNRQPAQGFFSLSVKVSGRAETYDNSSFFYHNLYLWIILLLISNFVLGNQPI